MPEREHPFWAEVSGERPLPPASRHLGLRFLEVERDSGTVRVEFEPKPEFANPRGDIQGGFLAAMLDDALGMALATTLGADESAVTLEMKVSFLRSAELGTLLGEGRVVHRGRSIAFLEGALRSTDGDTLATASMTARVRSARPERES